MTALSVQRDGRWMDKFRPHGISALGKGFLQMAVSGHPAGQDNFLKSCRNKSFLAFGYKNVHNGFPGKKQPRLPA